MSRIQTIWLANKLRLGEVMVNQDSQDDPETSLESSSKSPSIRNNETPSTRTDSSVLVERTVMGMRRSPLPPPEEFQGYENTLRGAADRILKMAENEQLNRHALQKQMVESDINIKKTGQWMGYSIFIALIGIGAWLAISGKETTGFWTMAAAIVSALITFFGSKWTSQNQISKTKED